LCAALLSSCDAPGVVDAATQTQVQALRGGVSASVVLGSDAAAVATIVDDEDNVVCSATFIAPHHVVTAAHCFQPGLTALEQAIGLQQLWLTTSTGLHLALLAVHAAPESDAAIVAVAGVADAFLAVRDDVNAADATTVYVAGAGRGVDAYDRRTAAFAVRDAAPLWTLSPLNDDDGLCPGDSGGPLLVERDGAWVVVGVHKSGQFDCRGDGHATPLFGLGAWIADVVAHDVVPIEHCDNDGATRCTGTVVERCAYGVWRGADCALAQYQCVAEDGDALCAATPCSGVSAAGECDGDTALTCRFGSLWREHCAASEVCALDDAEGRMGCVPCASVCDDACASFLDDDHHCGDCATACAPDEHCIAGDCIANEGEGEAQAEGEGEPNVDPAERTAREGCVQGISPSWVVLFVTLQRRRRRLRSRHEQRQR
jgi:hypothetical protein